MSDLFTGLDLAERRVVVAGGGARALGIVTRLLSAGAAVEVVAPVVETSLQDLAERDILTWTPRAYTAADLDDAWLVAAFTADADTDAEIRAEARRRRILSVVDDGSRSTTTRRATPGEVVLVGGGPGDPGLISVAGREAVLSADVVVVDRLAPLALLDELADDVEVIDVAKIPRGRFTPQEEINAVLVREARAGKAVVRLKGGDSFVFGRGMEEVLACEEAGIPVSVVPGITSATAAPGLAGIPVTHRGVVQGFAVVSGHAAPDDPRSTVDWAALGSSGLSIVVLMGVETLPAIARTLVGVGRAPSTPVACVMNAALPSQRVVSSTLGHLVEHGLPEGMRPPSVTVIGDVAAFADRPAHPAHPA